MLFLGNSLAYCSVPEEELDKEMRGLTSTSKDKDYVHQLVERIAKNDSVNVDFSIVNISAFERGFLQRPLSMNHLANVKNKKPDYLIVQIGENVSMNDLADPSKYEEEYVRLLAMFPDAKKLLLSLSGLRRERSM